MYPPVFEDFLAEAIMAWYDTAPHDKEAVLAACRDWSYTQHGKKGWQEVSVVAESDEKH